MPVRRDSDRADAGPNPVDTARLDMTRWVGRAEMNVRDECRYPGCGRIRCISCLG